tara:strand:+ start:1355 stop:2356 length:1002 start_codon:yes stop_codon:yes gene_type:complete
MKIGSALLHFLGGDEDSKGLAGGLKEQVVLEQDDNREIVRQTVSDVITDRKAKRERREAIINAHATNIDALRNNNYNFENSVSIAAAGQTDNYVKYANEYDGDVNDLWNYTSNVALDTGLSTREVAEQLTGPLIYSDIQYGDLTPSTGILGKLGIAPNLGKDVQKRVDMLSPIDPRDAEMKKLLVSGQGTALVADLEDTTTPRDFDLDNEILPLLLKRGPVEKPNAMTSETVEQGKLTNEEFANLKNLLGYANREFSITEKIAAGGGDSPATTALVNKFIVDRKLIQQLELQKNSQATAQADALQLKFNEEFNNLAPKLQTKVMEALRKEGFT